MRNSFGAVVGLMQLLLLVFWEGLGVYFGWPPLGVFLVWLVGVFTLNIATATVLNTFLKLTTPSAHIAVDDTIINADAPIITEEDGVG